MKAAIVVTWLDEPAAHLDGAPVAGFYLKEYLRAGHDVHNPSPRSAIALPQYLLRTLIGTFGFCEDRVSEWRPST